MKNEKLKTLFTILFFGAIWGIIEATLGTILHLDIFDSIIFSSTAVLLPIAFCLTYRSYKVTNKASTVFYVGLVAASIKAISFFFVPMINKVINPMVAIVLESSLMALAFKVSKPTSIYSLKSLLTFIVSSFAIRIAYVFYSMATAVPFQSAYLVDGIIQWNNIFEYVVIMNLISFAYFGIYMLIGFILTKINFSKFQTKIDKIAFSPIFSIALICVAFALTIIL